MSSEKGIIYQKRFEISQDQYSSQFTTYLIKKNEIKLFYQQIRKVHQLQLRKQYFHSQQLDNQKIIYFKKESNLLKALFLKKKTKIQVPKDEIPTISAKSWAIMNRTTGNIIWLKEGHRKREVASLTKIMTAYIVLQTVERLYLNIKELFFIISQKASQQPGTTANLNPGDKIKVIDLLYGLMLPSGNDAAYALAENFGYIIKCEKKQKFQVIDKIRNNNFIVKGKSKKRQNSNQNTPNHVQIIQEIGDYSKYFIIEMNNISNQLKLKNSSFDNVHGLMNRFNYSTAHDVCIISNYALKNQTFRQIVETVEYTCNIYDNNYNKQSLTWKNTNKLLNQGFKGIKTGITETAGPCLATYLKTPLCDLIIVVLSCSTLDHRWPETIKLAKWGYKRQNGQTIELQTQQLF